MERDSSSASIHLGLRGEVEYRAMLGILSQSDDSEEDIAVEVQERLKTALRQWAQADESVITPDRCRRRR